MIRADAPNSHFDPVRTKMTGTQQIMILRVCDLDEIESKQFLVDKTLSQVCYTSERETEKVIVDEILTEER